MSIHLRRTGPLVITAVVGIILVFAYPWSPATAVGKTLSDLYTTLLAWSTIFGVWAVFLGTLVLVRIHATWIYKRQPGQWYYSVWLLATLGGYFVAGFFGGTGGAVMRWLNTNINTVIATAIMAIEAFWTISATYTAYRLKTFDSIVLMVTAMVIMMMTAPIFDVIWPGFSPLGEWVMTVPNAAGQSAMIIAVGVGIVSLGIRTLLGRERAMGGVER